MIIYFLISHKNDNTDNDVNVIVGALFITKQDVPAGAARWAATNNYGGVVVVLLLFSSTTKKRKFITSLLRGSYENLICTGA